MSYVPAIRPVWADVRLNRRSREVMLTLMSPLMMKPAGGDVRYVTGDGASDVTGMYVMRGFQRSGGMISRFSCGPGCAR